MQTREGGVGRGESERERQRHRERTEYIGRGRGLREGVTKMSGSYRKEPLGEGYANHTL